MTDLVLGRIPTDIGKTIRCSADCHHVIEAGPCDRGCGRPATHVVRGETDSFGFEVSSQCEECFTKMAADVEKYMTAADVEDREGFFYISECTNYDGHGEWSKTFTSYRAAEAFLRAISDKADKWGGLYPNEGIREVPTAEELQDIKQRWSEANRERDLQEAWEAQQDEIWAKEREDRELVDAYDDY